MGRFIADFVCHDRKLVVEVDGGQHGGKSDQCRDTWFRSRGYTVLRVWNNDVLGNIEGVLDTILRAAGPPPSQPSPARGEG